MTDAEWERLTFNEYEAEVTAWKRREAREDRRVALLCAVVANCTPRKKGSKPFNVEDFMPVDPQEHREQSQQTFLAVLKSTFARGAQGTGDRGQGTES